MGVLFEKGCGCCLRREGGRLERHGGYAVEKALE